MWRCFKLKIYQIVCRLSNDKRLLRVVATWCFFLKYLPFGDRWSFSIGVQPPVERPPTPFGIRDPASSFYYPEPPRLFSRWTMGEIKIQSDMPRCHAATPTTFYLSAPPQPPNCEKPNSLTLQSVYLFVESILFNTHTHKNNVFIQIYKQSSIFLFHNTEVQSSRYGRNVCNSDVSTIFN